MTNETDTFVQEVDERLREERMLAFAKRYGPWIAAALVLLLVAIGGWQWWQEEQRNRARAHADRYAAALELMGGGDVAAAKEALEELTRSGPRAYRVMARMQHAALLVREGDLQGAIAGFDQAAEMARDPVLRESAQLRAAYLAADTQDFEALQARLEPLIESESRLSFLARELLAIEAWEAGQTELARSTLQDLSLAFDAPEGVRQRAQVALAVVGPAPAANEGATQPAPSQGDNR